MASPYLQFDKLTSLAAGGGYSENPYLSQMSAAFLLSACLYLRSRWLWQNPIEPIDDTTYENILEMIEQAEYDLMTQYAIGSIIPSICLQTAANLLLLDGQSVSQADYPVLTTCVPAAWLSGGDINLPDMVETGLFGATDSSDAGTIVGENAVTLDVSEIPSHTHIQNPHTHTYNQANVVTTAAGLEVALASLVTVLPAVTTAAVATNQNTGGDGSHNNVQQSLLTYYYIVAG